MGSQVFFLNTNISWIYIKKNEKHLCAHVGVRISKTKSIRKKIPRIVRESAAAGEKCLRNMLKNLRTFYGKCEEFN